MGWCKMNCENDHRIIGFVGKDPRIKNLPGGTLVADFSVATKSRWKDKKTGDWKEEVSWHLVKAWAYLAERVERDLKKGSYVRVQGPSVTETWTDKEGVKQYRKVIKAADLYLLEKKGRTVPEGATDSDRGGEKGDF